MFEQRLARADGVRGEANAPQPSASSFISLRRTPHRRELGTPWSIGRPLMQQLIDDRLTLDCIQGYQSQSVRAEPVEATRKASTLRRAQPGRKHDTTHHGPLR